MGVNVEHDTTTGYLGDRSECEGGPLQLIWVQNYMSAKYVWLWTVNSELLLSELLIDIELRNCTTNSTFVSSLFQHHHSSEEDCATNNNSTFVSVWRKLDQTTDWSLSTLDITIWSESRLVSRSLHLFIIISVTFYLWVCTTCIFNMGNLVVIFELHVDIVYSQNICFNTIILNFTNYCVVL